MDGAFAQPLLLRGLHAQRAAAGSAQQGALQPVHVAPPRIPTHLVTSSSCVHRVHSMR